MFSEEDFYLIREPDVICVAPMSDESIAMYRMWLRREYGGPEEGYKAPVNESMGLIGRVDDFRKKLEKQWRNTGWRKDITVVYLSYSEAINATESEKTTLCRQ